MSEERSREEVNQALDCAVAELLEAAGIPGPPVDAVRIARDHLRLDLDKGPRGRKATPDDASAEQRQLAAALLIASHCKCDLLARLGIDAEAGRLPGESLTGRFADRLLVPTPWLAERARSNGFDLFALKDLFSTTSHERIAWRFLDLDEPCIVTLIEDGRVTRRRSNAWPINRTLTEPEQQCQRQVHRTGQPGRISSDEWEILGWPIHESGRKREVLFSRRS